MTSREQQGRKSDNEIEQVLKGKQTDTFINNIGIKNQPCSRDGALTLTRQVSALRNLQSLGQENGCKSCSKFGFVSTDDAS